MTDIITTAPVTISRPLLSAVKFPRFGIRAALAALTAGYGRALQMAYVDPYRSTTLQQTSAPEADLEGRDPRW